MTENAAFRQQLGNAGPCAPHIATMQDLPRLAWLTSLGAAKGSSSGSRVLWAVLCYPGYAVGLSRLIQARQVWHVNRDLSMLVMPVGAKGGFSKLLACYLGAMAVAVVLSFVNPEMGSLVYRLIVMLVIVAAIPTLLAMPLLMSRRCRNAQTALKVWAETLDEQAYVIGCLTKHPCVRWGAGLPFARDVLAAAVPPGAPLAAQAFSQKEERYLKAVGFASLEHDGRPTWALVAGAGSAGDPRR